jgi:hypothetical protein
MTHQLEHGSFVLQASRIMLNVQVAFGDGQSRETTVVSAPTRPIRVAVNTNRMTITSWTTPDEWKAREAHTDVEAGFEIVKPPSLSRTTSADSSGSMGTVPAPRTGPNAYVGEKDW